jgi:uncharacterized beta-barrel protein YwiB (DUF1934 family)
MGRDKEETTEKYEGSFMDRGGKKYISYKRKTEDGEVDCLISYDRKGLTLTQKGALKSKLELILGQKTNNEYSTPMGALNLPIFTRRFDLRETASSAVLVIDYDIVAGGDPIITKMEIEIEY